MIFSFRTITYCFHAARYQVSTSLLESWPFLIYYLRVYKRTSIIFVGSQWAWCWDPSTLPQSLVTTQQKLLLYERVISVRKYLLLKLLKVYYCTWIAIWFWVGCAGQKWTTYSIICVLKLIAVHYWCGWEACIFCPTTHRWEPCASITVQCIR